MDTIYICPNNKDKAYEAALKDVNKKTEALYVNIPVIEAIELSRKPYDDKKTYTFLFNQPFENELLHKKLLERKTTLFRCIYVCAHSPTALLKSFCATKRVSVNPDKTCVYLGTGKNPPELHSYVKELKKSNIVSFVRKCHRYKASFNSVCKALLSITDRIDIISHYEHLFVISDKYIACMTEMLLIILDNR